MIFGHSMVRPPIHRFSPSSDVSEAVTPELSEELTLVQWGWVDFFDLYRNVWFVWDALRKGEYSNPEKAFLLEFADFSRARHGKIGVSFMRELMENGNHDSKWQPLSKPGVRGMERFFWTAADIEQHSASVFETGFGNLFVPSGWTNAVLDEIERRRERHESFFRLKVG